jgi:hypothetical protein
MSIAPGMLDDTTHHAWFAPVTLMLDARVVERVAGQPSSCWAGPTRYRTGIRGMSTGNASCYAVVGTPNVGDTGRRGDHLDAVMSQNGLWTQHQRVATTQ